MRIYFDLKDNQYTLPDVVGVEVDDVDQARAVAFEMIRKLRAEDAAGDRNWSGWTLRAVDSAGTVLFSIDLDSAVP